MARLAESPERVYSTATRDIRRICLDIDVRKHSDHGVHVIHLRGDLKLGDPVDGLRQACLDLMNDGENRLVVNLSEVPMIDSSGIGVLVRTLTQAKQHGGALSWSTHLNSRCRHSRSSGYEPFRIFPDESQAIQSFN